ncbi:unnamed protein product [Paramecium primaurelia]|uniref:Cyclic nucleotide-binding domain-containing protein n=1 Tax=Paramecium primaurelia TaxID=5886 RepID=A0A8S1PT22_PARPR|nr:unnamed protein product [Paramecium primaurelia]
MQKGDSSNEFFIIIDGSVNVYVRKKQERIQAEIELEENQLKTLTEEELEQHPSTIIKLYQAPKQLNRRQTINLKEDDFEQIAKSYKPRQFLQNDRQDVKHKDVELIKKLTSGLEKIPDKDFLFCGGVFLHELVAQIHEGQMFGERGLMIESARTGTVIAKTSLHVAILTKKDYKTILEDSQLEKIRKKTKLLSLTILKNLTYKEAVESQYKFEKVHYPISHYIYKIGDVPQSLIVIKKGTVKLFKKENNKIFPLCELGQDQYFGEVEYFEDCNRIHIAQVTSQEFSAYMITYQDLAKLFNNYPQCERLVRKQYEQRHKINDQRINKNLKTHKKFSYSEEFSKDLQNFQKNQSQPQLEIIIPNNDIPQSDFKIKEKAKQYSIQKSKYQLCQMDFIQTTQKKLKAIRRVQQNEQKKAQMENEQSLADTLNHLEVQSQLIKKEFRRREQRRFSCITFDKESQNGINQSQINQQPFSKTSQGTRPQTFDRQSSLSHQFKYQNITEQMLFNAKLQQYEILDDQQRDIKTPSASGIMISSKHNLFRTKPKKLFLMNHYERRQPKTYSTELSIKTFFN